MFKPHDLLLHHFHQTDRVSSWTAVLLHDALEAMTYHPPRDVEGWMTTTLQALRPMILMSGVGNLGFYQGDYVDLLCRPYQQTIPVILHPNKPQTSSSLVKRIRTSLAWPLDQPSLGDSSSRLGSSLVVEHQDRKAVSLIVRDGSTPAICDLDSALLSIPPMKMTHLILPFAGNDDDRAWIAGLTAWAQRPARIQEGAMFLTVCWLPEANVSIRSIQDALTSTQVPFYRHGQS